MSYMPHTAYMALVYCHSLSGKSRILLQVFPRFILAPVRHLSLP